MPVNEPRDFIFENYCKRIGFVKEESDYSVKRLKKKTFLLLLATKSIERTCDLRNAKERYQLFIRKKTQNQ